MIFKFWKEFLLNILISSYITVLIIRIKHCLKIKIILHDMTNLSIYFSSLKILIINMMLIILKLFTQHKSRVHEEANQWSFNIRKVCKLFWKNSIVLNLIILQWLRLSMTKFKFYLLLIAWFTLILLFILKWDVYLNFNKALLSFFLIFVNEKICKITKFQRKYRM